MSEATSIEWCDSTFNPWIGCTKVSIAATGGGGCDGCYAEVSTPVRVLRGKGIETWGPHAERHRTSAGNWALPLRWERAHEAFYAQHGRRRRVFCASLADVFDNQVPEAWRADLFALILATPNLDWLLLTKRIGNVQNMLPVPFDFEKHYPNVWLGITVVNQEEADRDVPKLLKTPARVRFLSMEPLRGAVKLRRIGEYTNASINIDALSGWTTRGQLAMSPSQGSSSVACMKELPALDWVIVGGESGPNARPSHPDWFRSLRDQCEVARVPFLFKQWGQWRPPLEGEPYDTTMGRAQTVPAFIVAKTGTVHCFENDATREGAAVMLRPAGGKKAAGRLLDGVEHNGFPEVR